ncbi:MAG: transposase [Proteobacteria bacterium]|nr:transposase [Pseudomonadota bacterium]
MEIITGIERRRRWRLEDKLRILAETEQPGAGVAEVARRHEISRSLIWNWRSQARRGRLTRAAVSAFLPVQVVSEPAPSAVSSPPASPVPPLNEGQIEISLPDGSRVRVGNDVSLAALRRVMSVLRG